MSVPEPPDIIETPNHFWYGPVDLATASQGNTQVESLPGGYLKLLRRSWLKATRQHQISSMTLLSLASQISNKKTR
jgi:hypothetical protein